MACHILFIFLSVFRNPQRPVNCWPRHWKMEGTNFSLAERHVSNTVQPPPVTQNARNRSPSHGSCKTGPLACPNPCLSIYSEPNTTSQNVHSAHGAATKLCGSTRRGCTAFDGVRQADMGPDGGRGHQLWGFPDTLMVWANPLVFSTSSKLMKNDNMHINQTPLFLAGIMVTLGQSGKPLTVGCVCTLAVFLSLSSHVPCKGSEWSSPLPKCFTASRPKVYCYEHWVKSFLSYFLGRICHSTYNFWYNRETQPFFPRPKF